MKLPPAHIERIRQLGYTESEARFLYIVAVFSGYFTLRQFRVFTGSSCGKRPTSFAQKLITQRHATARTRLREPPSFISFREPCIVRWTRTISVTASAIRLTSFALGLSSSTSFWPTWTWPTSKRNRTRSVLLRPIGDFPGLPSGQDLRGIHSRSADNSLFRRQVPPVCCPSNPRYSSCGYLQLRGFWTRKTVQLRLASFCLSTVVSPAQ